MNRMFDYADPRRDVVDSPTFMSVVDLRYRFACANITSMELVRELTVVRERLENQLRSIHAELDAVSKTIALLQRERSAATASPQAQSKEFAKMGLSEGIRAALTQDFQTPVNIRDSMLRGGFPAQKSKLLNSVYATLKRLATKGREVEAGKIDGINAYRKKQFASEAKAAN
jgi:hypothetical protein